MTDAQTTTPAEAPHIDVRILPHAERHARIFGTLGTLTPGGALFITSDHEPRPLHYQLETAFPGKFAWEYLEQGPEVWRVEITRLDSGCDCCCGSN
jgi:uncharacterized protein (DUF2249 family)